MATNRVNEKITSIIEGCAKAQNPTDYASGRLTILRSDYSWTSAEIAEILAAVSDYLKNHTS